MTFFRRDAQRFVKLHELPSLELWTGDDVLQHCAKFGERCPGLYLIPTDFMSHMRDEIRRRESGSTFNTRKIPLER